MRSQTPGALSRFVRTGPVFSSNVLVLPSLFAPEHVFSTKTESNVPAAGLLILKNTAVMDFSKDSWKDEKFLLFREERAFPSLSTQCRPVKEPAKRDVEAADNPRRSGSSRTALLSRPLIHWTMQFVKQRSNSVSRCFSIFRKAK